MSHFRLSAAYGAMLTICAGFAWGKAGLLRTRSLFAPEEHQLRCTGCGKNRAVRSDGQLVSAWDRRLAKDRTVVRVHLDESPAGSYRDGGVVERGVEAALRIE